MGSPEAPECFRFTRDAILRVGVNIHSVLIGVTDEFRDTIRSYVRGEVSAYTTRTAII